MIKSSISFAIFALLLAAVTVNSAHAETFNWSGPTTGASPWNVDANWDGLGFPTSPGDEANLSLELTGNQTVNLVVPVTVGSLTLGSSAGNQTQALAPGAGGILTFDNLGNGATLTRVAGGTGNVTVSAPIVLAEDLTVTHDGGGTLTLSAGVSGSAGLIKEGAGRLTLSGTSTYTGDTIINDGFLLASGAASPSGYGRGNFHVNGTGRYEVASTTSINGLFGDGSVALSGGTTRILAIGNANTSSTFSGQFLPGTGTGVLNITKLRDGTLTLNPTQTYANKGIVTVDGGNGFLILDFANMATPTDLINPESGLTFGGGTMVFKGQAGAVLTSQTSNPDIRLTRGSSAIVVDQNGGNGTTLNLASTIDRTATSTIDFSVIGENSSIKSSIVNNGAGIIGGFATFGNGATWAIQAGMSTLGGLAEEDYLTTMVGGTDAGNYLATSNVDVNSSPGLLNGGISVSTLRFNSAASNTLSLQGTNTTNGILVTNAVGSNHSLITGGTIRGALVGGATARDLIVHQYNTAGALEIASQIVDNGEATGLTKSGPGTLRISNTSNNYTGQTFVGNGTLQLGASEVIPHSTAALVLFTTLDMNGFDETIFSLASTDNAIVTNSAANPATLSITGTAGSSMIGSIQDGVGKVSLVKSGSGALALGMNLGPENNFSGTTTINSGSGVVTLNNSGALKNSTVTFATGTLAFGTTVESKQFTLGGLSGSGNLTLASSTAPIAPIALSVGNNGESTTYSGTLSGGGSLTKIGGGVTALEGNNTYTGTTTVNGGTLLINGQPTGTGAVAVNNGGTLGGTGTILGTITVNHGGTIAPGTSPGTLTVTDIVLTDGAVSSYDLDPTAVLASPLGDGSAGDDLLVVTGTLTFDSDPNLTINISTSEFGGGNLSQGFYRLATLANLITTTPGSVTINAPLAAGDSAQIYYNPTDVGFDGGLFLQVVPEPNAFILAGIGIIGLTLVWKRRSA